MKSQSSRKDSSVRRHCLTRTGKCNQCQLMLMSLLLLCGILLPNTESRADGKAGTGLQDQQTPTRVISTPFLLELIWIPPGRFRMGDITGSGQADEQPLREVDVSGFWMMRTEVTRGMFAHFAGDSGHHTGNRCWIHEGGWAEKDGLDWKAPGFSQSDDHPVTCVNWHDAQAFITWLNHKSGEAFRLPSEAEWEYAARAGSESVYYMGDEPAELCAHANAADKMALTHYPGFAVNDCDDGYVRTSPAASFAASPWGLYDIYGNVWEWVQDCWRASYAGAPTDGSAVLEGDCTRRGFRGGGYGDIPHFARSTLRNRGDARHRKDDIGFRLAISGPKAVSAGP